MKKLFFTLTMTAVLAIANLQNASAFSGGSGSSDDPYLISNITDLEGVRAVATQGLHFKMTADIALSDDWITIGTWGSDGASEAFQGYFDGNGHAISGLQVTNGNDRGLFGWVKNSTIKNLTVQTNDTGISGYLDSGDGKFAILAGSVGDGQIHGNTTIENCTISGKVSGGTDCGGLLGQCSSTTVINCRVENVDVQTVMWNAGGVVGCLRGEGSTFTGCQINNINVGTTSHNAIGGMMGTIESSTPSVITDCTVTGLTFHAHPGGEGAGGIAGFTQQANISGCTVTGISLSADDFAHQGGLLGIVQNTATIDSCHVSGLTGFNLGEACGGFVGQIESNVSINNSLVTDAILEGRGTTAGFIGKRTGSATGTITNCKAYATIKSIPDASWAETLGGFIGDNEGGEVISNCLFVGSVAQGALQDYFTSTEVGGFAGVSSAQTGSYAFENCAVIANVNVQWPVYSWDDTGVGGFVGLMKTNYDTTTGQISNCFFSGTVQGAGKVGGFAGTLQAGGMISNCYAHAAITSTGSEKIGGFVGHRWVAGPAITDSYFIGSINQTGDEVGTFCGMDEGDSEISGCAQSIQGINPCGNGSLSVVSVDEADLKTLSKYTGLNGFVCEDGLTYPYLSGQSAPVAVSKAISGSVSGTLTNTAEKVEVLFDYLPLASVSPASTSWKIELPELSTGDVINILAFENGKMVSYPVLALIEESSNAINEINASTDPIVSVRYFNLQGITIAHPVNNNIYIVKFILKSGKEKVGKMLFRQ